ncbi:MULTISPECIES: hypothetical protein [Methylobacterium]|nr:MULTISPECIES: hypothetical protein [Methylobacterium]
MLRRLLSEQGLSITSVNASPNGIRLGLGEAAHVEAVRDYALKRGWLITMERQKNISIEPSYTSVAHVPPGTRLYHVSDASRHESILKDGIEPREGGNTTVNRTYPRRLHLCHKLGSTLAFLNFQVRSQPSFNSGPDGRPVSIGAISASRKLSDLNVYVMSARANMNFYQDSHFEGGIWTEEGFGKDEIELMPRTEWEEIYKKLYPDPPSGLEAFEHLMTRACSFHTEA